MTHDATPAQPFAGRRFHMMGIGGAGVSALAQLAHAWGAEVTGCDGAHSRFVDLVEEHGIAVTIGHDAAHVDGTAELVVSSAIPVTHPERARAAELGVRSWLRGELLGELTRARDTVVVAGAHGKSTTTAMIAHIASTCGVDVSLALGGTVGSGGNVRVGSSPWFIVEGDESDRTLLQLAARVAVVTNIERDHHHTFASDAEVEALFSTWVNSLEPGAVIIVGPGDACDRLVSSVRDHEIVRFGDDEATLVEIAGIVPSPGRHNALNAAAAIEAVVRMGVDRAAALDALASFPGVGRRFEHGGSAAGVTIVDDYAHHPTEVAAAIEGGRDWQRSHGDGRVVVCFQPHLYSRTRELHADFAAALASADEVFVFPIYGAREAPEEGVTSALITDAMSELASGAHGRVHVVAGDPATDDLATIISELRSGDLVMTMGAGDITVLGPRLGAALQSRAPEAGAPS